MNLIRFSSSTSTAVGFHIFHPNVDRGSSRGPSGAIRSCIVWFIREILEEKIKVARYDDVYCRAQRRRTTIRWLPITGAQAITRSQSREPSQLVHEVHYARIAQVQYVYDDFKLELVLHLKGTFHACQVSYSATQVIGRTHPIFTFSLQDIVKALFVGILERRADLL